MASPRLVLIATLEVRRAASAAFERFETQAAAIMSRWDGRIERVIRLDDEPASYLFREVHIVTFPDEASFHAYRTDPGLALIKNLREEAIVSTSIVQGRDLAIYGGSD